MIRGKITRLKFKENNLELSINSYANSPKEEVTFSYQFLQTLPYNTRYYADL